MMRDVAIGMLLMLAANATGMGLAWLIGRLYA